MARPANTNTGFAVLKFLAFVLLTQLALSAQAAEGVLIETMPAGIEKAAALTAVREALKYRQWTVVAEDADSVSATISRYGVDARIRIRLSGTRLLYVESARGKSKLDYTGRVVPSATATPDRWINYLRSDISAGLQAGATPGLTTTADEATTKSAVAGEEPAARGTAVQRMQDLKEMLDKGLITPDEYARKKDEILKRL